MRKILLRLTASALLWLLPASGLSQGPAWVEDYDQAKVQALKENKLILVDVWASWCEPCLRMDAQTWGQWTVVAESRKFVCVRLDADRHAATIVWLAAEVLPTVLVLDPFGTVMFRTKGFKSADEIVGILKPFPASMAGVYAIMKRLEGAPDSINLQVSLGDEYHNLYFPELSNSHYEEFLDEATPGENPKLEERALTGMALNYQALGNQERAVELLEKCLTISGSRDFRPLQLFLLTRMYLLEGKETMAREKLELLRKEFPGDKHRSMAEALFTK